MKKADINILVVDDDQSSRAALAEAVKRAGYKVTEASKVEDALNAVRIKPVHAAIIDCMLPRMNGIQLAAELRASRFGSAPLIMVSGIFKDKAFAQDAIKKTGALEYYAKPVPMLGMVELLDEKLAELVDAPKVPLHALLSKPYASARERSKALESIEEITGLDLPLVISILMDSESTGYLNVATKDGDVSGITFVKGGIIKVDTAESHTMVGGLLIKKGFLTQRDFEELPEKQRRGDVLKHLINESLISPHAAEVIKGEQVIYGLLGLLKNNPLQMNFVPERVRDKGTPVSAVQLTPIFWEVINRDFQLSWFEKFYQDWLEHPMRKGPEFAADHQVMALGFLDKLPDFVQTLNRELTINEVFSEKKYDRLAFFRALHIIALRRLIVFDDVKRSKNLEEQLARLKVIYKEVEKKNPFQVFEYFGAGSNPNPKEVEKIYKEFARANHPDLLPPTVSEDVRKTVHRVYAIVSDAYDVLTNEAKREKFVSGQRQEEVEKQLKAEGIAEEAMVQLRRGRATYALERLKEAYKINPRTSIGVLLCWAKLKSYTGDVPYEVQKEVQGMLDDVPNEERRSPNYLFVSALLKKAAGDIEGAQAQLDKALTIDGNFLDARREVASLRNVKKPGANTDTFTGELTSVLGKFFAKKTAKK